MEKTEKLKTCNDCGETKSLDLFAKNRGICKACKKAMDARYYSAKKQEIKERTSAYRKDNIEKHRGWQKKWRSKPENKAKQTAGTARYNAGKDQRTPAWADQEAIAYVYHAAQVIKEVYGTEWHVDHIIPLHGERVSGLHVANNLQLLSPTDNIQKSNQYQDLR